MKLNVASPCPMSWEKMSGDDRSRFCSRCKLHVYNLSAMTEEELQTLLMRREGRRLCGRFFQRSDGTVMTKDCPVGWRRRILKRISIAAALLVSLAFGTTLFGSSRRPANQPAWVRTVMEWLGVAEERRAMVGEICVPAPPAPQMKR